MRPAVRKLTLTAHLVASVGWIGAVIGYIALGLAAAGGGADSETIRAAWIGMELTGWYVIVPLAIASLLTGLVISLGTPWGLFRHYWVVISLLLTVVCVVVLVVHMPSVSATTAMLRVGAASGAAGTSGGQHGGHGGAGGDLFHPSVGLAILLAITALNVFKPRGLTPYGWRRQQEERAAAAHHPRITEELPA